MDKEELKKKIVEIIIDAIWKDAEADYDSTDETEACSIADALIAEGYGDVKTVREIGASAAAMAVFEAAEAEHRAEVAERALDLLAEYAHEFYTKTRFVGGYFVNHPKAIRRKFLKQAEKELAEERKDENN